MAFRSALLASVLCAGCATASHANQQHPPADAPEGVDAPARRPDASPRPDGDIQPPDAPPGGCAFSGVLATWDLSGLTGTNSSAPATSTQGGVTAGPLSIAGVTAISANKCLDAKNWPTAAQLDPTRYFTLSITPPTGCTLSLTSMAIDALASATGPTTAVVATSADQFGQTSPVSTTAPSAPNLTVTGATAAIELRVYGYGAGSSAGALRVQNTLSISGSLQ